MLHIVLIVLLVIAAAVIVIGEYHIMLIDYIKRRMTNTMDLLPEQIIFLLGCIAMKSNIVQNRQNTTMMQRSQIKELADIHANVLPPIIKKFAIMSPEKQLGTWLGVVDQLKRIESRIDSMIDPDGYSSLDINEILNDAPERPFMTYHVSTFEPSEKFVPAY